MSPSRKAFDKLIATGFIPCISGHISGTIYDSADGTGTFLILTIGRGNRHFRAKLSPEETFDLTRFLQSLQTQHRTPSP